MEIKLAARLRAWLDASLANRMAWAAGKLALGISSVVALIAFASIGVLVARQLEITVRAQSVASANLGASALTAAIERVRELARHSMVINGLIDSSGRQSYLVPFLEQDPFRERLEGALVICDAAGDVIASVGDLPGRTHCAPIPAQESRKTAGLAQVSVTRESGEIYLNIRNPIYIEATGSVEGLVIGRVSARRILEDAGVWRDSALIGVELDGMRQAKAGRGPEEGAFRVDAMAPLAARVEDREPVLRTFHVSPLAPLYGPTKLILVVFAFTLFVLVLMVTHLARRQAARLTLPLMRLKDATALASKGERVELDRVLIRADEIGSLATAVKTMADSLQDQGASLREAQRIAGIGSWEHVLGGDAVRWSEGLNLVLGRDAATGPPAFAALSRYYTPASWERLRTATAATIQTGAPFELELEMVREDGTKCWTTTRGEALRGPDGAVAGVRGTVHDITERKRVEEQLRHQTALLEAQANASIDGILVVDSEGRKIFQNRRTVELWKIPKEVAEDSDDAAQVRHVMNLTRNPGQFAERVAYLYSHPDETTRDEVELLDGTVLDRYSAPVLGKEGEVYGRIWMFRDITEARLGEERIRAALAEKEVLLKEIYHRVKNNLQVVSSLLSLQSRRVADVATKRLLDDSANRVNSMALVHEQLYRAGNLSSIGLAEYLRQLTDSLVSVNQPLSTRVVLRLEVDEVTLGVESAIPLGLVANELVSNAYRHGYDAMAARGEIVVRLTGLPDGRVCLVVQDDGRGLPADFEPGRGGSLGMQLVMTLAQQLGAELTWNSGDGCTCFTLRFAPPAALAAQEAVA